MANRKRDKEYEALLRFMRDDYLPLDLMTAAEALGIHRNTVFNRGAWIERPEFKQAQQEAERRAQQVLANLRADRLRQTTFGICRLTRPARIKTASRITRRSHCTP